MAKNDNLKDFLTDLADAIREKKGTSNPINPQDFTSEIASIETGGGGEATVVTSKDVNFYDYDGTLLHSYTWNQAMALTELPPLPTQKGLICQEWNYTLDDIRAQEPIKKCDVGATYITDDEKTRLYITISHVLRNDITLIFYQNIVSGVTVNWGDGSEEESFTTQGRITCVHNYTSVGNYVITLSVATNCSARLGGGGFSYPAIIPAKRLYKAEIGARVTPETAAFTNSFLETISLPNSWLTSNHYISDCRVLRALIYPNRTSSLPNISGSYNLRVVSMPPTAKSAGQGNLIGVERLIFPVGVTTINYYSNLWRLKELAIPPTVKYFQQSALDRCGYNIDKLTIPESTITLSDNSFYEWDKIVNIDIPPSVTTIGYSCFYNCKNVKTVTFRSSPSIANSAFYGLEDVVMYDFSRVNSVPALSSTNVFSSASSDYKMIVPLRLYDEWTSATNWSYYSSYIVPDYEPIECTSLTITAENVSGRATSTVIHWTAITNARSAFTGETEVGVEATGQAISEEFPQNTSYTEVVERTISYTYMGVTATTIITQGVWVDQSYTLDLNNGQWALSETIPNPDDTLYDGVYQSVKSKGVGNGYDTMYIDIVGYETFKLYIRSYAQSSYDYVMVSQLDQTITGSTSYSDTTLVKAYTRGKQQSGTAISNYTLVEFTGIDTGSHRITIVYRKNASTNTGDDRGYVLIPKEQ